MKLANDLFQPLDRIKNRLPLGTLRSWCQQTPLAYEDFADYVRFHPDRYQRNLVHSGPTYHVLLLCWRSGQRSPIHDHEGSACLVKVLRGQATETRFARAANGMIYPVGSRTLAEGNITFSADAEVHQVSNLQAEEDLVTLHVYSPPLRYMNVYSLLDGSVSRQLDPINEELVGGAGI